MSVFDMLMDKSLKTTLKGQFCSNGGGWNGVDVRSLQEIVSGSCVSCGWML